MSTGALTLEVGAMTEEVSVSSRVIELQTTSGERSFTLESEALKNIANNGRVLFNFATLVPGALPQSTGGTEIGPVSGFTVNGQRPNSNNITIDGVANIDTGDNGGNMATTNIDAVAEFKVLTNAYQAEYGRAVGGQLQVVTKSGSRDFHGSGYWYGRRSDWDANSYLNKRDDAGGAEGRRPRATTPATPSAGRCSCPGFNAEQEEAVLLLQPGVRAAHQSGDRAQDARADRARAAGRFLAERRQQRQSVPLRPRLHHRPALQRLRHARLLRRTAACSAGFRPTGSMRPDWPP